MNKIIKFFIRIVIVILVLVLIFFCINKIFKIKHQKSLNDSAVEDWNWYKENQLIYNMLLDKYPTEDSENFMMVMRKDIDIPKKEKDEKRILVIGDSYIYGWGLSNINYTWWRQLDLKIKEAGYSNVNVYGAGRYFTNTKDQLEKILKNKVLMDKINPDLIIIGWVANDPEERDEANKVNLIKTLGDPTPEDNELYKNNPILYKELEERYSLMEVDYDKLKSMGDLLGKYRWDIWSLMVVEGERFERYKGIIKDVDNYIKELDIPYFYYFTDKTNNELAEKAKEKVHNAMCDMKIESYFYPLTPEEIRKKLPPGNEYDSLVTNPADWHPGIAQTYYFADYLYDILKNNYKFLFNNKKMQDASKLELNINDTTPYLKVNKRKEKVFEFEYPKEEKIKEVNSNFLYYPIEKNYIKLNLEYPKNISKIKVTGENLESAEIYVNTIDEKYGYDINEVRKELTPCRYILNNTHLVNKKITSVNIHAVLNKGKNRKIQIEFVE